MSSNRVKIVVLCAGPGREFDILKKPRHLYHVNGKVQLLRFLEPFIALEPPPPSYRFVVNKKYESSFKAFFKRQNMPVEVVVNHHYNDSSIHSVWAGLSGLETYPGSILLTVGDECFHPKTVARIYRDPSGFSCFSRSVDGTDVYPFVGILKFSTKFIPLFQDKSYLNKDFYTDGILKNYFKRYPTSSVPSLQSGYALGLMMIHLIWNVALRFPKEISFLDGHQSFTDLDHITQTDEYKNSRYFRVRYFIESILLKYSFKVFFLIYKRQYRTIFDKIMSFIR